jgi:hypothetical protein
LPMYVNNNRWERLAFLRGPAVWLWLSSFVVVWLAVALVARPNSPPQRE